MAVTVAKEIDLEDPFENMGAQLLKEAATKTNDVAGDGTTTATVIAQTIVTEGLRNLAAGANPMILKRGLARGVESVVQAVRDMAVAVQGREDIANIAAISANDPEIGRLIADVMDRVGKDGVITVEESRGLQFEIDYVEGMEFDRGYISPYFVTNQDTMRAELEDPYLLITEQKLSSVQELVPLLEKLMQTGKKELVVIAEDVEGEGAGDAGRQQAAGHCERGGHQGAGLRRPPQGATQGHCDPHGWSGHQRGSGAQARQRATL